MPEGVTPKFFVDFPCPDPPMSEFYAELFGWSFTADEFDEILPGVKPNLGS